MPTDMTGLIAVHMNESEELATLRERIEHLETGMAAHLELLRRVNEVMENVAAWPNSELGLAVQGAIRAD